jgi:ferredoxin-NADP reductase
MRADLFDIDCDFYVAGPEPFVAALDGQLADAGVPRSQRFTEVV